MTASAAIQGGSAVAGGIIGMIGQKKREKRAMKNQVKLMDIQQQNQMALNEQGKQLALEQWKDTNYSAQVDEIKKAGMNVGLLYGMGGSGGTTANAGSGGNASGGSAPSPMAMDINAQTMASIGLMLAQTKKTNAEADNIAGVEKENVEADTALKRMNTANAEIQNNIGELTSESIIQQVGANANKAVSEARSADTTADVNSATKQAQIDEIKAEARVEAFKLAVMKSGIELNEATKAKMIEDIRIGKFNANINAEYQGIDKVTGSIINKIMGDIEKTIGAEGEHTKTIK